MKKTLILGLITTLSLFSCNNKPATNPDTNEQTNEIKEPMNTANIYDFSVNDISGNAFDLSSLKGKKVMIVNTASKCGLTPQFEQLEALYQQYKDQNFVIIGFPSNDFMEQDPGTNAEIAEFCQKNYGVTFPMMEKITVKGENIHPLYAYLTQEKLNGKGDYEVQWNFQKFLIDENGQLVQMIDPKTLPNTAEIIQWIEGK